jgi:hypothetical protein
MGVHCCQWRVEHDRDQQEASSVFGIHLVCGDMVELFMASGIDVNPRTLSLVLRVSIGNRLGS